MRIHILGICGTFMGSLAVLAKELGHEVDGSDQNVYPPMSTQLQAQGIRLCQGYDPAHLQPAPDLVIVGNAISRGNPAIEYVLNEGIPYTSGPAWLAQAVLAGRHVVGVAGTHGKTTTTSMVAWILDQAGLVPGFLIGGVPMGFSASARLGAGKCFVVEADEYDSAFFDKRSKFIHYAPRTAILNNLEFDHADIFEDLEAIKKQFHHLVRTIPGAGRIILPASDENLTSVLARGCWTAVDRFQVIDTASESAAAWVAVPVTVDGGQFQVLLEGEVQGEVHWSLSGRHNVANGVAAIMAAHHCGVPIAQSCQALTRFPGVKRRMEVVGTANGVTVYDDFAHHPTAIETTLAGLRHRVGDARIWAVIEPRSNTMRMGSHRDKLAPSVRDASYALWYQPPGLDWDLGPVITDSPVPAELFGDIDVLMDRLLQELKAGDHVVIMSNGAFGGIHQRLMTKLRALG